jgi:hypothetical protein
MRVADGVSHGGGDAAFKVFGDHVFKPFCFFVDFIP